MSLTGTAFFALCVVLVPAVVALMLLVWNRVPGPIGVRVASRVGMVVLSQAAAVLTVLVWVNNNYGLYESWNDLMGDNGQVQLNDVGHEGGGSPTGAGQGGGGPAGHLKFTRAKGGALGTVAVGILFFEEPLGAARLLLIVGLIGCIAGLKLVSH